MALVAQPAPPFMGPGGLPMGSGGMPPAYTGGPPMAMPGAAPPYMPMGMPMGPPMAPPMGSFSNLQQGAPMPPQRLPPWMPPNAPQIPARIAFPGQRQMDSAPEDGPVSVACHNRPEVVKTCQMYPCPDTNQYLHRGLSIFQERELAQPSQAGDICGIVMATSSLDDDNFSAQDDLMNVRHNELRLVFQCLSGWTLMHWRSQEDFEAGIYGARRAPRPLAWWDLRKAWDVHVEVGDMEADIVPHRIVVNMHQGNLYFLVELPETVPAWYFGIRGLIKDNAMHQMKARDSPMHQRKRWPVACGIAQAILGGQGIGERALAITFHTFDIDYDCFLQVGELVLLIRELSAGVLFAEGRAEGQDRETALFSMSHRTSEDELFERAVRFRRSCDSVGDGRVRKDDFIRNGLSALLEAVDIPAFVGGGDGHESMGFLSGVFE